MNNHKDQNRPYIICSRKKSMPKVSLIICENCKRMGKCLDYKDYVQPTLFPGISKTVPPFKRKIKIRRVKPEAGDPKSNTSQLIFDF